VNIKVVITEMYPWISWELVTDSLEFAEDTSGTTAMVYYLWGHLKSTVHATEVSDVWDL